ncbi:terminase small subunit [Shimia ponticola]|uniref:terminase small subunit n=1 Tax=Shimia ponticola TaxID=2582893 RepID=UPI0011BED0F5|nr:terminase small subunit [Shimia ponticola]
MTDAQHADLDQWLADHPLPDGQECIDLNMTEAAQVFGVSVNTVKDWINDPELPMPVVSRGTNGKQYVLRFSWCYAWRAHREAARADRDRKLASMQASLINIAPASDDAPALTSKQIGEAARAAMDMARAERERGRLTEIDAVFNLLEGLMVTFRNGALGLPDRLERELQLTPPETRKVERALEELLESLGAEISESLIGPAYEANLDMNPQLTLS